MEMLLTWYLYIKLIQCNDQISIWFKPKKTIFVYIVHCQWLISDSTDDIMNVNFFVDLVPMISFAVYSFSIFFKKNTHFFLQNWFLEFTVSLNQHNFINDSQTTIRSNRPG